MTSMCLGHQKTKAQSTEIKDPKIVELDLLCFRLIEVVLVEDESTGEDVAEETGECRFAAGGAAGDADDEGFGSGHDL